MIDTGLLSSLANALAPSGFEKNVREIIAERLTELGYEPVTDNIGNVYVVLGEERPSLLLAAHMDEVGLLTSFITDNGFLRVTPLGGVTPEGLPGQVVEVLTARGTVEGVIGSTPPHLRTGPSKELSIDDLYVDIGVSTRKEAEERGVEVGTPISFQGNFRDLGDIIISKALDDRVGCYALLKALEEGAKPRRGSVIVAFTVQEELGLRGASVLAKELEPNYAVAVEGTLANDVPGVPPEKYVTRLGAGPAIRIMDRSMVAGVEFFRHIRTLAEQNSLPYQIQISPYSGTDAGSFLVHGATVSAVSVPVRYIHSPASLASKRDIENTTKLLQLLIEDPFP
ncbi:MAG: M42 family metallopeptidase [Thermofilum sp.]|uniref:M42 family metallopeptidase n=1 Tax=Thermofilum sp. TaxID=1961369 RepID=UPI0025841E16|nr:M42 family metallopeptidase [Thermofilum sp.]MCI4408146.1 M42 family metallopeptidase [Thermofilum sp.]